MTQEDKDLLLKDLCARLPYGVMVSVQGGEFDSYKYPYQLTAVSKFGLDSFCKVYHPIYTPFGVVPNVEYIKPYLRPLSSMTDSEKRHISKMICLRTYDNGVVHDTAYPVYIPYYVMEDCLSYLRSIHIDYSGLIEKGLALEAPEGMYTLNK